MADKASCDILVVGAGPAGGAAALAAAQRGANVWVADRKPVVGTPVRCAEYIPAPLLGRLDIGTSFIVQRTETMKTFLPDEPVREIRAPGFVINRDILDQSLIQAARDAGCRVMLATQVCRRVDDRTVLLKQNSGPTIEVHADIIIGADGPHSTVGRWVGAVNRRLMPGIQATLPLTTPMDWTEVHFYPAIYAGYGWLFPKVNVANVGIGLIKTPDPDCILRRLLDGFIDQLRSEGKVNGNPARYTAGWIPAEPVRPAVYGNVALAGDAAGHTHPITGAGIANAVICGDIAGKWSARAAESGDPGLLKQYDAQWRDFLEASHNRAFRRRLHMEAGWRDFPNIIKSCWMAFRDDYA